MNGGELSRLCDQNVFIADSELYSDKIPANVSFDASEYSLILDAELEFVAIVTRSGAAALVEIINSYEPRANAEDL